MMVEAIEDDRKTMTRRVVKDKQTLAVIEAGILKGIETLCPYGQIGDVLWVKETHWAFGEWEPNGTTKTGKQRWEFKRHIDTDVVFKKPGTVMPLRYRKAGWYKRPSLFLQKRDARIFLRITNIRVERLQDISEEDAKKEGVQALRYGYKHYTLKGASAEHARHSFLTLWKSINGEQSWNSNPYVWVIEFEKISKP